MSFNISVAHQSNVNPEKTPLDIVCYTIIVLLGTTGNSLIIWVAGNRMKPSITNVWLINLAVADLIFCVTQMTSLIKIFIGYWPFGDFICKLKGFLKYANMFCSVFLLAVISVDRVLCVWHPVFTRKKRTLYAARVVSLGVWIVAVIFSSPNFAFWEVYPVQNNSTCSLKEEVKATNSAKYFNYIRFFCGFLFPFLVILICYTLAAIGIRRMRFSGKSRSLRILALLVFAFFLCWAPYHILHLKKLMNKNDTYVGWHMAKNLAYFNSCVNPMLYFCMGLNLRRRSGQSLLGIFHRALTEEGRTLSQNGTIEECSSRPL